MSSTTYRQLVLRLPDGLKQTMRERVGNDIGLVGVEFAPVKKGSRRFTFTMDENIYPARLVDLPCILETQKTLDRTTFFKSGDVGQMLIVYKDENAYKRDESNASGVGPQELFPDGLTPPTKNVVRRRFLKARPDRRKFKRTEVIRVESQVLKIQQDGSLPEGSDSTKRLVGNGSSSSSSAAGGGAAGGATSGGGGGGSSSRPGGAGGGGSSRSLRPTGGDSSRGRSGGGGVGNGGSNGGAGGGVGETVTFEHEEIVEFEPWMADPEMAAVGRLEGVTIEITGPTQKLEADNTGQSSLSHPAPPPLPRLFDSELLYEHPEMLLAALDLNRQDPGAENTEPSEKPKVEPSEKPKVEPFEKPKVEITTAADAAVPTDATRAAAAPVAAVGGEATSSVSKPIVQASPTMAREVEQQQQDQQAPRQQDQQAPQQQDQQAPQQQDQQAPQQQDQQAPQQQQLQNHQDQQKPQQQDQQAPQQQQLQNHQDQQKPQQQQQQPSPSGVATDMTRPASSGPPTPVRGVGHNSDEGLNHMDDSDTLDTLNELGIEDLFADVTGDLGDPVAWLEEDEDLAPATEL